MVILVRFSGFCAQIVVIFGCGVGHFFGKSGKPRWVVGVGDAENRGGGHEKWSLSNDVLMPTGAMIKEAP